MTLVAAIERPSGYCRTVGTSCGVLDVHGHPDSRPTAKQVLQAQTPCPLGMAAITGMRRDATGFR
jgi:hypothetical protein